MKKLILLFTLSLLLVGMAWGQTYLINEGFNGGTTPPTGWTMTGLGTYTSAGNFGASSPSLKFDTTGDVLTTTTFASGAQKVSFWLKGQTTTSSLLLEAYYNSTWNTVATLAITPALNTADTYTYDLNSATTQVRFTYSKTTSNIAFDDLKVWYESVSPAVSVNPTSLNGFTYQTGSGPSTTQTFTVSGTNLTANISLAAATNYEISLSAASGYATPLTLTQASGSVSTTTIYARLKSGLTTGDYNAQTINITSSGASAQTVTCSGTVTALAAPNPPVANDATNITANSFSANWTAASGATNYYLDVYTRTGSGGATDLFISEYIEGSGSNKYIEIYNGTGSPVDLSDYKLQLYANGASTTTNDVTLSGTLENGACVVYKNSVATLTLPTGVTATNNTAVNFNGNDAVALYKISTSSYVDIFGRIGNDPGTAWTGDGGYTTVDKTLVRKPAVTGGITVSPTGTGVGAFPTLTTEWDMYATDIATYLGSHSLGRSLTYVPGYQNLSTGNVTSYAVTGLSPLTAYYYVVRASNANGTSANSNEKSATTTAGSTPPLAPVATDATSISQNSFVANWNASAGATSYRLDVSLNNAFSSFVTGYNNLTVNTTNQAVTGLTITTPYYYRVRAYNAYGTSTNSNTISVTTLGSDSFNGYYNPVAGMSGATLKTGLHDLIDSNIYSNYDGAKLELFQTLDNTGGVVKCVYTGQTWTVNSSYNGSSDPNTEHTYAQSWFSGAEGAIKKADVHHLFVSSMPVNSSRGNLPFDVVTTVSNTYTSNPAYVSKRGTNASGKTVWEPTDQHKGNLARALLYFNVRYGQTLSQGGVDMLSRLITWHNADPVDAAELARNTAVYTHQGNRNPFVDHPEYVSSIWGEATSTTVVQFSPASAQVNEGAGSITLNVTITNPSSTPTTAQVVLSSGDAADVNSYTTTNITFPASSSANKTVTVNITDDALIEGYETLVFSLQNVSGGNSAAAGNYGSFNLTIEDNDIPVPVATAATTITATGFTANWTAAASITDYQIDVSTSATFSTFASGYADFVVSGTTLAVTGLSSNTQYYYRVRSLYGDMAGANSNVINLTTAQTSTPTTTIALRPVQMDISDATSESAVLVTVQYYPSDDAKYKLYSGTNQYYVWKPDTAEYISATGYADNPSIPGTPSTSTTWWIPFQRGTNNSTAASYRDRLGPAYSANYKTVTLPTATAIASPASILMGQVTFSTWNTYTSKYVALAYDATTAGTLISATSTALGTGNFNLKVETGTIIRRIEIRDLSNNLIESVTGTWPQTLNPEIVVAGEPDLLYNIAGSPSEEVSSYLLQGVDLTSNIELVAPQYFELSAANIGPWTSTLSLSPAFDGEVFVRINSNVVGGHTGGITHNSTGATEVSVLVEGETIAPSATINVTQSLTAFTQTTGTPSAAQSYAVSGTNLSGGIEITAEAPFELSQNGSTLWGASLSLAANYSGNVWVRLNGDAVGTYTDKKITHNSANASPVEFTVTGTINVPTGPVANLFFSEYVEGSSYNKAIEIYNASGSAVDLSRYAVELYSNGAATVSTTLVLSGTLAAGAVYIIADVQAIQTIKDLADTTSAVVSFNGDDALALRCLNPSTIIDVFGQIGTDPGTGWPVAGTANATVDHTLVRKPTVASGTTDWQAQFGTTTANSEWILNAVNDITNLGTHTYNPTGNYAEMPVFDPVGGTYLSAVTVTITSATPAAAIRYTTNGTDPSATVGTLYSGPFQVSVSTTIKAVAYAAGFDASTIVTTNYTLPTPIANIAALRTQPTGNTYAYTLTGAAVLTYKNATRNVKYIQDATAAIVIDDLGGIITTPYNLYDGITGITGYLNAYNGLIQFIPLANSAAATSTNNVVVPEVRTLASLVSADQAKLVKIMNVTITHATYTAFPATAQNLIATDASGTRTLRTFVGTDYAGALIPVDAVNMICLVGQFNTDMQVGPRFLSDIQAIGGTLDTPVVTIVRNVNNVELSWNAITGASGYRVESADDPYGTFTPAGTTTGNGATTITIAATPAKKFFHVIALP